MLTIPSGIHPGPPYGRVAPAGDFGGVGVIPAIGVGDKSCPIG
jgi:hypothetical protein